MKPQTILDCMLFQLTPTRTRCELYVVAGDITEKLTSGLLKPFLSHLQSAEEQLAKGGYSLRLEPPDPQKASWFTKGTAERFVRFVSTPEVLERATNVELELIQLEETMQMQTSHSSRVEDMLSVHSPSNSSLGDGSSSLERPTPSVKMKQGSTDSSDSGVDKNSKKQLIRALDARRIILQKEQGMAFARAVAAGFDLVNMIDLVVFSDCFGAARLREACFKFVALCKKREVAGFCAEDIQSLHPGMNSACPNVPITRMFQSKEYEEICSPRRNCDQSMEDGHPDIALDHGTSIGNNRSLSQDAFSHKTFLAWQVRSQNYSLSLHPPYHFVGQANDPDLSQYWHEHPLVPLHGYPQLDIADGYITTAKPPSAETSSRMNDCANDLTHGSDETGSLSSSLGWERSRVPAQKRFTNSRELNHSTIVKPPSLISVASSMRKHVDENQAIRECRERTDSSSSFEQTRKGASIFFDHVNGSYEPKSNKDQDATDSPVFSKQGFCVDAPFNVNTKASQFREDSMYKHDWQADEGGKGDCVNDAAVVCSSIMSSLKTANMQGVVFKREAYMEGVAQQGLKSSDDSFFVHGKSQEWQMGSGMQVGTWSDQTYDRLGADQKPSNRQEHGDPLVISLANTSAVKPSSRVMDMDISLLESATKKQVIVTEKCVIPSLQPSKERVKRFLDQYNEKREAKLNNEPESKKVAREANMKTMQNLLQKRKAEMEKSCRPEKLGVLAEAKLRAEKLRAYKASLQKIKEEKEAAERRRLEELKSRRQERIAARSNSSPFGTPANQRLLRSQASTPRPSPLPKKLKASPTPSPVQKKIKASPGPSPQQRIMKAREPIGTGLPPKSSTNNPKTSGGNRLSRSVPSSTDLRKQWGSALTTKGPRLNFEAGSVRSSNSKLPATATAAVGAKKAQTGHAPTLRSSNSLARDSKVRSSSIATGRPESLSRVGQAKSVRSSAEISRTSLDKKVATGSRGVGNPGLSSRTVSKTLNRDMKPQQPPGVKGNTAKQKADLLERSGKKKEPVTTGRLKRPHSNGLRFDGIPSTEQENKLRTAGDTRQTANSGHRSALKRVSRATDKRVATSLSTKATEASYSSPVVAAGTEQANPTSESMCRTSSSKKALLREARGYQSSISNASSSIDAAAAQQEKQPPTTQYPLRSSKPGSMTSADFLKVSSFDPRLQLFERVSTLNDHRTKYPVVPKMETSNGNSSSSNASPESLKANSNPCHMISTSASAVSVFSKKDAPLCQDASFQTPIKEQPKGFKRLLTFGWKSPPSSPSQDRGGDRESTASNKSYRTSSVGTSQGSKKNTGGTNHSQDKQRSEGSAVKASRALSFLANFRSKAV